MLQIDIVGFSGENLILEVGGHPNAGKSKCKKNEDVKWKIKDGCGVKLIHSIKMKDMSGNEDIFSANPPKPVNTDGKQWMAKVNNNVQVGDAYVYNIEWVKENETQIRKYDPIITIRPVRLISLELYNTTLTTAVVAALAAITLGVLLYFSKQENNRLKNNDQITVPVK
jgi:hypothetical protein